MAVFEDLTGNKYGMLTVLFRAEDYIQPSGQHKRMWHCICDCGNECNVRANDLKSGNTVSCGCFQAKTRGASTFDDLTGRQFGKLTVLYRMPNHITPSGQSKRIWHCRCSCGTERDYYSEQLKNGMESCGCTIKEKRKLKEKQKAENETRIRIERKKQKEQAIIEKQKEKEQAIIEKQKEKDVKKEEQNKKKRDNFNKKLKTNSLGILCPQISNEWDSLRNGNITPLDVLASSSQKVWWICPNCHNSYDMSISSRTGKSKCGCPFCSSPAKRLLVGFNDLETKNPQVASEWHPTKNGELMPNMFLSGTAKKVWWLCPNGHEYEMSICSRTGDKPLSCPYCSHQRILTGFSDLATTHPYILSEWDYEKNDVSPYEISVGYHQKIWWKCPFGHSYQAYPSNRCGRQHTGCPICDKENHTSFPEQAIYYYIKKYYPSAINSDRKRIGMELDVYIPELDIAVEYDGQTWHRNNLFEQKKNLICKEQGTKLIRIREKGLSLYEDCICLEREDNRSFDSLSKTISDLLVLIGNVEADIDVERDASIIYSSYIETRKSKSLESVFPDIALEWHPTKNDKLTPAMVAPVANKKVWWQCSNGHEYQMEVSNRTNQKCGCPYCAGKQILKGFNDLLTKYPDLCREWDYQKNSISPDEVAAYSDKKAWWKCNLCGFSWLAKIDGRTRMHVGCPQCGKVKISQSKCKPVQNIETGVVYLSSKEAEMSTGISRSSIGMVCRGNAKTAGGYHWKFAKK